MVPLREGETVVVHVAEKPSIAEAIARALSAKKDERKTRQGATPVHELHDVPFAPPGCTPIRKAKHRVTAVAGHVFSTDFPAQYQSWSTVAPS